MTEKELHVRVQSGRRLAGAFLCVAMLALAVLVPGRASAALTVPLTVEEMAAVSDQVVHAKVADSQTEWYHGKLITRHRLTVIESLKGDKSANQEMELVTLGGKGELISSISPGMPTLEPKEEVVLFLSDPPTEKEARAINPNINMESPLVQSPQIIGGLQGKFNVVRTTKTEMVAEKEMTWEDVRIVRHGVRTGSKDQPPTLERFRSQLTTVLTNAKTLKRSTRSIPTVGTFEAVKEQKAFDALRAFDPFPRRAQEMQKNLPRTAVPTKKIKAVDDETQAKVQTEE
ncbi:hypothetical protein KQI84_02160 [bacterium]|nr:hypothetical protein [bacterium]